MQAPGRDGSVQEAEARGGHAVGGVPLSDPICASPAAYLGDMNANGQAQGLRKAAEGPSAGLVGRGVTVSLLPPWGIQRGDGTWSWAPLLDAPGLIPLDALTRALAQRLRRNGSRARVGAGAGITQHCPTLPSLPAEAMSDYENDDECWSALEGFRVTLTSVIDPSRITPYLRQCKVLNPDDEEQVLSDPNLVIRKRKVGQCCPAGPRPQTQPRSQLRGGCTLCHPDPQPQESPAWLCPWPLTEAQPQPWHVARPPASPAGLVLPRGQRGSHCSGGS